MPDLTSMKNIGAEMARKLAAAGIRTPEVKADLKEFSGALKGKGGSPR